MEPTEHKERAGRNRTLVLTEKDKQTLRSRLRSVSKPTTFTAPIQSTILGDYTKVAPFLPDQFVDLLILDPPYNLTKSFNGRKFARRSVAEYTEWLDAVIGSVRHQFLRCVRAI